jgi:hypothetical protein
MAKHSLNLIQKLVTLHLTKPIKLLNFGQNDNALFDYLLKFGMIFIIFENE